MRVNKKSQLIAIQLFDSNSFLTLNKKLLEMFGPNLAVFTCNLVDKYKYFSSRNMIQDDGSFFLTFENQAKDTGMSRCELRSCKKRLVKMRVLKTLMKGVPAKEFYFLSMENLLEKFLTASDKEIEPLEVRNPYDLGLENLTNIKDTLSNENLSNENKTTLCDSEESPSDNSKAKLSSPGKSNKPTPEQIVEAWNKQANKSELPSVAKLTPGRRTKIYSRIKSNADLRNIRDWSRLFRKMAALPFLCGHGETGWKATFDWVVKDDNNYVKVIEGVYDDLCKPKSKPKTRLGGAEVIDGKYDNIKTIVYNSDNGETTSKGE